MFFWNLWWGFRDLTYKIICHILQSCPSTITEQGARQKPPPTQREEMIESLARGTMWPWFSFGMTFAPSTLGRDELAIALGSVPSKDKAMTAWISFIFCKRLYYLAFLRRIKQTCYHFNPKGRNIYSVFFKDQWKNLCWLKQTSEHLPVFNRKQKQMFYSEVLPTLEPDW